MGSNLRFFALILKSFRPFIVIVLVGIVIAVLPEILPDHGLVARAIYDGDAERARTLLDRGADPNSRSRALSEICWWLFDSNSSDTGRRPPDLSEQAPLVTLALDKNQFEIARLLLEHGADPNARDAAGFTVLFKAVALEDAGLVGLMIDKGANPDATMPADGGTALYEGPERAGRLRTQNSEIVKLLSRK